MTHQHSKTVIVVGAGPAGLAAASRLLKSGVINVTLLEAADRLGGRIFSSKFNGLNVELGAQFVHGQEGNVGYPIAQEMMLIDEPNKNSLDDFNEIYFKEDGSIFSAELADELFKGIEKAEEEHVVVDIGESLGTFLDETIANLTADKDQSFRANALLLKDQYHREVQVDWACDNWYENSFNGSAKQYQETEGDTIITFKSDKKYADLLEYFTKDIPDERVRLNSEVTRVELSADGVSVQVNGEEKLLADYIIFTGSLGYLKKHAKELFVPSLPADKLEAIDQQGFGTVDKIFLEYKQPWWPQDLDGFTFMYETPSDYSEAAAERDWTRSIVGLYRVRHRDNLLMAWIAGTGARKMESMADEKILEDVVGVAEKFLRKGYPNMTSPVGMKVTRWHSNPFVLGSYSHVSVASAKSGKLATSILARPEGEMRLLFAGEATNVEHFATVHGAIETGWREADRVIAML